MAFAGPLVGPEHLRSSLQEHLCLVMALPRRLSATPPGIFPHGQGCLLSPKISSSLHSARTTGEGERQEKRRRWLCWEGWVAEEAGNPS